MQRGSPEAVFFIFNLEGGRQMDKEKIRPLYAEFQGYLSQAPLSKVASYEPIYDPSLIDHYHATIKLLTSVAEEDYSRFCVQPPEGEKWVHIVTYRQQLGGLISYLHGKYFTNEPAPFSGGPSTIITQSQQQSQFIQMVLDVQSKIDEQMPHFSDGSKEKGFLQKLKSSLSSISNVTQLLNQLFKLAKEFGLNIDSASKIFS